MRTVRSRYWLSQQAFRTQHGVCKPVCWTLDRRFPLLLQSHDQDHPRRTARRHLFDVDDGVGELCRSAIGPRTPRVRSGGDFCNAARSRRASEDHRRLCRLGRARRLFLGLADGQPLQPPARRRAGDQDGALRPDRPRAAQPPGHDHRLCRSGRTPGRLPQSGRGLRPGRAGARCLAGRDPGAGFRRPLLGLPGGRPAHRQFRAARQDVRHQARLLPAGRTELEGRGAEGHHQGVPRLDQYRRGGAAHLPGRVRRRTSAPSRRRCARS